MYLEFQQELINCTFCSFGAQDAWLAATGDRAAVRSAKASASCRVMSDIAAAAACGECGLSASEAYPVKKVEVMVVDSTSVVKVDIPVFRCTRYVVVNVP